LGSQNAHHPLWGGVNAVADIPGKTVIETIDRFNLTSNTPEGVPTWARNEESSTIDLALTDQDTTRRLIRCRVLTDPRDIQGSDHKAILTELQLQLPKTIAPTRRNWAGIDHKEFFDHYRAKLQPTVPRDDITDRDSLEAAVNNITVPIQDTITNCVPVLKLTEWSRPGFTPACKEKIQEAHRLQRRWQQSRDPADWEEYRKARNAKGRFVKKCLTNIHREKINKATQDAGALWKLAKWARNRGSTRQGFTPAMQNPDGTAAIEPEEKVNLLARRFFPEPPEAELDDLIDFDYEGYLHRLRAGKDDAPIECPEITPDEVLAAIKKTKAGKAPGPSGIPNQILHLCQHTLAQRLVEVMNASLRLGMYPRQWKTSITRQLEIEVAKAERWAKTHASVFAPDKFAIQHFSKDQKQPITAPITIRNNVREPESLGFFRVRVLG
jgi:hypothetical protein